MTGDDFEESTDPEIIKPNRTRARKWVTDKLKQLTMGTRPSRQQPIVTLEEVHDVGRKLLFYDTHSPDDKGQDYVDKIGQIVKLIEAEEEKLLRHEIEQEERNVKRRSLELERKKIEAEEQKLEEERTLAQELLQLQIEEKKALIEQAKAKTASITSPKPKPTPSAVRLDVKIPPFDGSPCHYRQFEELFESIVEKNPAYDDATKYLYFISLIGKSAHDFAPNLSPTLANLQIVKDRMKEHFENPARVREHVKRTFDRLPLVRQHSQTTILHLLIVAWEEGVLALRKSGTTDDQINNTYVRLMTTHLSGAIIKDIKFNRDWTADMLIATLKVFHKEQLTINEYSADAFHSPNRDIKPRIHFNMTKVESPIRPTGSSPVRSPKRVQNRPSTRPPLTQSSPVRPSFSGFRPTEVCAFCAGNHLNIYCNSFDVNKRREIAEQKKLCSRCLRNDHYYLDCKSKYRCPCGEPHSRVLCGQSSNRITSIVSPRSSINSQQMVLRTPDNNIISNQQQQTHPKSLVESPASTSSMSMHATSSSNSNSSTNNQLKYARPELLVSYYKTVVVRINNERVRVLIDGGCGRSSILESCAKRLNLPEYAQHDLKVSGMGGNNHMTSKSLVSAILNSVVTGHQLGVVLAVVPTFGEFKPAAIPADLWKELDGTGFSISDSPNYHAMPIEIILGLEYVGHIWLNMERMITDDITIRESIFGWTAFGVTFKQTDKKDRPPRSVSLMCCSYESIPMDCRPSSQLTIEEKNYLEDFVESKVRIEDNRCVVQLPWLSPTNLGTNEKQAYDRFHRLEKSLRRRGRFERYAAIMEETIAKFAEPAPVVPESKKVYYLPHHCVIRLDKETTQTRVVYDGSASENGFSSLNDALFKGVSSWNSLDRLVSFRFGEHAILADIEKAFLQIKVDRKDRDALRFWWFNNNNEPTAYRFTSVPFGTSASPFLLYASMYKLFKSTINNFENPRMGRIASLIKDRFYVDDFNLSMQGVSEEQIKQIREEIVSMFSLVSMNIRKWRTNVKEIDKEWSPDGKPEVGFLGHLFDTVNDTISLTVDLPPFINYSVVTKRLFSSLLARIYDPMGFVSPYTVHLRLFLRKLWTHSLDWDEPVPEELRKEALTTVKDAHLVNQVTVKRNVLSTDEVEAKLLVFCDASKLALGAVAYSQINNDVHLLFSRSKLVRLSPSKKDDEDTIAKLELDALVMGSELANYVNNLSVVSMLPDMEFRTSPPFTSTNIVICSDSLLNLQRLVKPINDQRSSISLKIDKMAKLVPGASYRHVVSKENPADLISRGCSMTELLNNKWFNPHPPSEFTRFDDEIRTVIAAVSTSTTTECQCRRFGSYGGAIHAFRFIVRGFRRALSEDRRMVPPIVFGKILLIKYLQRQHFGAEIEALTKKEKVDSASVLRSYDSFLDEDGILRIRTRLHSGANLTFDQVKPILLPSKCHIVELFVQFEHERLGHPGSDRTMFAVRDQFFALGLRKYVRKLISQCIMCKLLRGKTCTVNFGKVPEFRYDFGSTPFTNVGIDIFGPLKVAMTTPGKRYGVIFSCATTRAVHIELIQNQKAESVFQSLLNFMARRGVPHRIYTDNGVNLLAVKKQLVKFLNQISEFHPELNLHVEWIQLTVASPWRGGFYERLIRTIKDTLIAITFGKTIDNDALATALYQVEARLNSRPLFVYEGQMITPSHFFAKRPLTQIPPISSKCYAVCDKPKLIHYYKAMQSHVNAVWNAWYSQYLLTLKSFHQNLFVPNASDSLRVGDAVILKNSTPSSKWPFGVVEEVYKSEDGLIRTVYVRTHDKGRLTVKARDVRTLIPFECTQELHEEDDAKESTEPNPDRPEPEAALTGSLRE